MKKLPRKEAVEILRDYLNHEIIQLPWFKNIKLFVKAIIFYGSTAKGLNTSTSDLDLLIFVPLAIEKKYTVGEYSYFFKDREINIVLRSIERLRTLAREHNNIFEAETFRNCEILFESDAEVRTLIDKIQQRATTI
jgi:predicted nucleotidyltransferase